MRKSRFWSVKEYLQEANPFPISVIAGRDGKLYQVRNGFLGRIVVPIIEDRTLDDIKPGFEMKLPKKLPIEMLSQTIAFFKAYVNEVFEEEAMVQIFWDTFHEEYIIAPPHQLVSKFRVRHRTQDKFIAKGRYIQVAQIHSHNTMEAAFSSIDDENELDYMIYGVIGKLHTATPGIKFRVGSQGSFFDIPLEVIFDSTDIAEISYPKEWNELIIVGGDEQ